VGGARKEGGGSEEGQLPPVPLPPPPPAGCPLGRNYNRDKVPYDNNTHAKV